jgi:hypothetical protein
MVVTKVLMLSFWSRTALAEGERPTDIVIVRIGRVQSQAVATRRADKRVLLGINIWA